MFLGWRIDMVNIRILRHIPIILVIASGTLISACAKQNDPRSIKGVTEEIREYYDRFSEYYNVDPYYVSAEFVEEVGDERTVAVCRSWSNGYRQISIEIGFWSGLTDYGKEQLVFHELGHCVLNRGHNNSVDNGCPESIMNDSAFGDSKCYSDYRDELIAELGE
jgi:hypothetical protein